MKQTLKSTILLCLLACPGLSLAWDAGERADNSETTIAGQLRGTWIAVSMERKGRKEEAPKNRELTFAFDVTKVLITEGTHKEEWSYQTRDGKVPWEIDLIPMKGQPQPPGLIIKGIYRIDGDTLKLSFAIGGTRPTGFSSKDDESGVITFKRKK